MQGRSELTITIPSSSPTPSPWPPEANSPIFISSSFQIAAKLSQQISQVEHALAHLSPTQLQARQYLKTILDSLTQEALEDIDLESTSTNRDLQSFSFSEEHIRISAGIKDVGYESEPDVISVPRSPYEVFTP
jgi:hypothetical protein